MPDVKLPHYTGGYPEDAAVHVRRAVEQHAALFGRPAERHVAGRGIGLPDDAAAAGPARHPLDRHRRGSPQRLDARPRQPRRQGPRRQSRPMYRPYKVREGDAELAIVFRDHALSDLIGFHYQRSEPASGGRRFPELPVAASARRSATAAGAGQRHPRRRKLLGALSRRRRAFPARLYQRCTRDAGRQAR